jgi:hypothetical protein
VSEERLRIAAALAVKFEHGRQLDEQLVHEVMRELYGGDPPPEAVAAALTTLENIARRRGEGSDPPS